MRSALAVVRADPAYSQYSDIEGVLSDYLASITGSGGTRSKTTPASTGSGCVHDVHHPQRVGVGKGVRETEDDAGRVLRSPSGSPTSSSGAGATPSPLPSTGTWERVKTRLAVVPWFLAAGAAVVIGGVFLLRRRRA